MNHWFYFDRSTAKLSAKQYKTEDFNYLAFPRLYPYGRGYDKRITC